MMADEDTKTNTNEEEQMQDALEHLATQDKQAKLQEFVKYGDAIRSPKDSSSSEILRPHAHNFNDMNDDEKQQQHDNKTRSEYMAITAERRARFQVILKRMNELKFKLSKSTKLQFTIDSNKTFSIETRVTFSKPFRNEPTVWYLETIMPSTPDIFIKYWGESRYRLKWDTQISLHHKTELYRDNKSWLHVLNNQTVAAVGGLISPRQFINLVQVWRINENKQIGLELASQSIVYKDYPPKKGFVDAWNTLYGHRITMIDNKELTEKYGVPELKVKMNDDGDGDIDGNIGILRWCKCQYMLQTDIKGWLPTSIVETGISGGCIATFEMCREYILREVFGLNVKVTKSN